MTEQLICPECENVISHVNGQCTTNLLIGDTAVFKGCVKCSCGCVISFDAWYVPAIECIEITDVKKAGEQ